MMDGAITVVSEYGRGSTFNIRMRQKMISEMSIGKEVVDNLVNFNFNTIRPCHELDTLIDQWIQEKNSETKQILNRTY